MELAAGASIEGRYTVLDAIGRGAMAVVYLVRHEQLGTLHALKVLQVPSRVVRQRLVTEGRIQGSLHHPNVVAVTDLVDVEGSPGLVMELVRGPGLDRLRREIPLHAEAARALGTGVLLGVQAAHRQGHLHRDLKPANVLVDVVAGRLVAKVADFGLAKLLGPDDDSVGATRTGSTLGTPAYMAPEQIRDARSVDVRADVFSLGALLYELVSGARAFPGADILEVYDRIRAGRFEPLASKVPGCPPELDEAVSRALVVDRDARLPDVDALLELWTRGGAVASEHPWADEVVARVVGMGPLAGAATSITPSPSTTFHSLGQDPVPPPVGPPEAVAVYETSDPGSAPAPAPAGRSGRRVGGATAIVVAALTAGATFFAVLAVVGTVAGLLATGTLEWGHNAPPVAVDVAEAISADPPGIRDGDFEAVARDLRARLGAPTPGACIVPRDCLVLGTALLWLGDARGWTWLDRADADARGKRLPSGLAHAAGVAAREGVDPDAIGPLLAQAGDDLLVRMLFAAVPGWDLDKRVGLLENRTLAGRDERGVALGLVWLDLQRGRADAAGARLVKLRQAAPEQIEVRAALAAWALATGDVDLAVHEADAAAGRGSPSIARVRAGAHRHRASPGAPTALTGLAAALTDPDELLAFRVGWAEAALGLGHVSEARDQLDAAYDAVADPLATWPAAQLHAEIALLLEEPAELRRAAGRLRALSGALGAAPHESRRFSSRALALEAVAFMIEDDRRGFDDAVRQLRDRPNTAAVVENLEAHLAARHGVVPTVEALPTCVGQIRAARALDASGAADTSLLEAITSGTSRCGRTGVDRYVTAEAWSRLAGHRFRAGDRAGAREALDRFEGLVEGFEPPFVVAAGRLEEDLALAP